MVRYLDKKDDFYDLVQNGITLVDFYADWCGPCKLMNNILEEIDYMEVIKVNTDEYDDLAKKHGVMSIPTLCFYKDGLMMYKEIGYRTPDEIKEVFKKIND